MTRLEIKTIRKDIHTEMVCFFEIKLDMTQITRYWDYCYPRYTLYMYWYETKEKDKSLDKCHELKKKRYVVYHGIVLHELCGRVC